MTMDILNYIIISHMCKMALSVTYANYEGLHLNSLRPTDVTSTNCQYDIDFQYE